MKQATDYDLPFGTLLGSAALGALVMYMLDPERGAARRAVSREKLRALGHQAGDVLGQATQGIGQRAESAMGSMAPVSSGTRADGAAGGSGYPGQGQQQSWGSAAQQHGSSMQSSSPSSFSSHTDPMSSMAAGWNLSMRNLAMLGGGGVGVYSLYTLLARRAPLATLFGVAGLAMLAGRASGKPLGRPLHNLALGAPAGRMVDVEQSVRIDAPPDEVYQLWSNYENFPRFMANVVSVRDLGDRRSHWIVKGPAGTEFAFDAVLTEQERPHRLAWASAPGSEVEHYGSVQLEQVRGGTRATVRMRYRPPVGMAGRAVAKLLGQDPKRELGDDLERMKSLVEGKFGRSAMPPSAHGGSLH